MPTRNLALFVRAFNAAAPCICLLWLLGAFVYAHASGRPLII